MSDDLRDEAAAIARALKRKVQRQHALGLGELLANGVARVQREGIRPDRLATPAEGAPDAPVTMAGVAASTVTGTVDAGTAAVPAAEHGFVLSPPPPEVRVPKRAAHKAAEPSPLDDIALPPFTADLHPSALAGGRDGLHERSLPVLEAVAAEARACTKCGLCTTRTNAVPGIGSARSGIVFVGEAPGADEDLRGEPFVGRAGELLTKMIAGMDEKGLIPGVPLNRETVYIVNVLKCRPPENRNPLPHEIDACSPYVLRQLEALQPRIICCLGKFAAELLLQLKGTIASMRGRTYRWRGAKLIVTYHPAYCLRSPSAKRPVWDDLQRLAQEYLTD
jgi:uracil-DNA glycosylase family 4